MRLSIATMVGAAAKICTVKNNKSPPATNLVIVWAFPSAEEAKEETESTVPQVSFSTEQGMGIYATVAEMLEIASHPNSIVLPVLDQLAINISDQMTIHVS